MADSEVDSPSLEVMEQRRQATTALLNTLCSYYPDTHGSAAKNTLRNSVHVLCTVLSSIVYEAALNGTDINQAMELTERVLSKMFALTREDFDVAKVHTFH